MSGQDEPEDGVFEERLRAVPERGRTRLCDLLRQLRDLDEVVEPWSPPVEEGEDGARRIALGHASYHPVVDEIRGLLYEYELIVPFDWPSWDGIERYVGGEALASAPVADAVRMLTTVIRKERFVDGQLVGSIEDGTVPAALERMCTWWAEDA